MDFVDVGGYFYQIQEYLAWCFRDADGNEGWPIRTFDASIGPDRLIDSQMVGGEIVVPHPVIQEPVDM